MRQLAWAGRVDFSRARLLDPKWHRMLNAFIAEQHQANERNLFGQLLQFHLAGYTNDLLASESRSSHASKALKAIEFVYHSLRGERVVTEQEEQVQQATRLKSAWEESYGNLNDPETQKRIDAVVEAMEKQAAKNKKEAGR